MRSDLQTRLKDAGIPTMVYYPKCMHEQGAFEGNFSQKADCPVAAESCKIVLSLPIHPYFTKEDISFVVNTINEKLK